MNKKDTILFKRFAAALLLSLFLCIHVVKVVHRHSAQQSSNEISTGVKKVSSSSHCSVCDYHLAKDSHHFNEFPVVSTQQKIFSSYSFYNTPFVTSIGSASSGRGPPSLS